MQLVGAHHYLIRRPFMMRGITQGFIAALFAIVLLIAALYIAEKQLEGLVQFSGFPDPGNCFWIILITGLADCLDFHLAFGK